MHPISYIKGIEEIGKVIKKTKIIPNYINVGGGFPTIYPDLISQPMLNYFNEIKSGLNKLKLDKMPEVICEPGRAIVAESGSTIVRVILRKNKNCLLTMVPMELFLMPVFQILFIHLNLLLKIELSQKK